MTRNDQLLLHLAQGLGVGDAAKEDDHDVGAIGGLNHGTATLINTDRPLLAQFGLTPKSRRGLAAGEGGIGAVDWLT